MADRKKRGDIGKAKKSAKGKPKVKKSGRRVHEIHLRRAQSGELLAKHKHAPGADGMPGEDEEHVVPEGGLDDHVATHLPAEQPPVSSPQPSPGGMLGGM